MEPPMLNVPAAAPMFAVKGPATLLGLTWMFPPTLSEPDALTNDPPVVRNLTVPPERLPPLKLTRAPDRVTSEANELTALLKVRLPPVTLTEPPALPVLVPERLRSPPPALVKLPVNVAP